MSPPAPPPPMFSTWRLPALNEQLRISPWLTFEMTMNLVPVGAQMALKLRFSNVGPQWFTLPAELSRLNKVMPLVAQYSDVPNPAPPEMLSFPAVPTNRRLFLVAMLTPAVNR